MSSTILFAIEIATYLFAFGLTFVSGYLVYRQRLAAFQIIREFVLGVYLLIAILMALDFARITVGGESFMGVYRVLSTPVSMAQAVLLLAAAVAVYLRPMNSSFKNFPSILKNARKHIIVFELFITITVVSVLYSLVGKPSVITRAVDLAGRSVPAMGVAPDSIYLILVLLGFFLSYPVLLLVLAARKIKIPLFRRGLMVLPIGWAIVSTMYVIIESYLWIDGVDATALLYAINAVVFFIVTREFRGAAVLGGVVETVPNVPRPLPKFSDRIGKRMGFLRGTVSLYEADPTASYEITLRELAYELNSLGDTVFVVTSRGSRVYRALSDLDQIRLFTFSSNISYIVPTEKPNEVLIPSHDSALLLDTLEKAVKSRSINVTLILDSLSDMILDDGFKQTHQFVKQVLEIFSYHTVTVIAVMFQNAHETSILNAMRSLFSNHVVEDDKIGPRVSKFQDSETNLDFGQELDGI